MKKIADILECETQMSEHVDDQFLENIKRTRSLLEKKWDVCISSRVLRTLSEGKWNTPQLLPFTEDIIKMWAPWILQWRQETAGRAPRSLQGRQAAETILLNCQQ